MGETHSLRAFEFPFLSKFDIIERKRFLKIGEFVVTFVLDQASLVQAYWQNVDEAEAPKIQMSLLLVAVAWLEVVLKTMLMVVHLININSLF